jgi:hypothetical protein
LRQFFVEAVSLSLISGAVGIGVGTVGARTIANSFQWPALVSTNAIAVAFLLSAAIDAVAQSGRRPAGILNASNWNASDHGSS